MDCGARGHLIIIKAGAADAGETCIREPYKPPSWVTGVTDSPNAAAVRAEVEALHRFFVAWFSGSCANDRGLFERELLQRLDAAFILVPPAGIVLTRDELTKSISSGYGSNPDFRITIRNLNVRRVWKRHLLATYEEWQRNARASTPPDNGRVATVLFAIENGLRWLHVHETWLPEPVMRAGPYDF